MDNNNGHNQMKYYDNDVKDQSSAESSTNSKILNKTVKFKNQRWLTKNINK